MAISPAYLGAGLLTTYTYGPLSPERGLYAVSCFGDVAFCSDNICIALAGSPMINVTVPIPAATIIDIVDGLNLVRLTRCMWRLADGSPNIIQDIIWGQAETKGYRLLCPRLYALTAAGDIYIYTCLLAKTNTAYIPAGCIQQEVKRLHTLHLITATCTDVYLVASCGEDFLHGMEAVLLRITIISDNGDMPGGMLTSESHSITRVAAMPVSGPVLFVAYESLTGIAAVLGPSYCAIINVNTGKSTLLTSSQITGGGTAEIHKVALSPASPVDSGHLHLYAASFDSMLHICEVIPHISPNSPYNLVHHASLYLDGTWDPVSSLSAATTVNTKLKSVVPPCIIHNLEGSAACEDLTPWHTEEYQLQPAENSVRIRLPSEIKDSQCSIADLVSISPSLLALLTMNGAVLLLELDKLHTGRKITATTTQFLYSHLADSTMASVAGPSPVSPTLIPQLLCIRRAQITPLQLIISSFLPISISALCLYKPLGGTTQQRLLRTTAHRLSLSYANQSLIHAHMIGSKVFIQQPIVRDATPVLRMPDCTSNNALGIFNHLTYLRAEGVLKPQDCREAFIAVLQKSTCGETLPLGAVASLLNSSTNTDITKEAHSSVCVFTGAFCSDLSLPFCERCEIVLSQSIIDLLNQLDLLLRQGPSAYNIHEDPLVSLLVQLGTIHWLCPICLHSLQYI